MTICAGVLIALVVAPGCGVKKSALASRNTERRTVSTQKVSPDDGPGVTSDEVKVGFVALDTKRLAKALALNFADAGNVDAQIQAMVDDANAKGGIAGRKIVPVIRHYEAFTDNAPKEEALCKGFTQDDKVFAVVLVGQFQTNARPCYAQADTVIMDTTAYPLDQKALEELAPYEWQPSYPEYGNLLSALVQSLDKSKFFEKSKLAIVAIDNPQNKRVYKERVAPALKKLGVKPIDVRWIDPSSSATLQAGQEQAVLSFKGKGVDRLLVIGGSRLATFMMDTAKKQNYYPRFAETAWDNPEFAIRNYPDAMKGAVGVSLLPGYEAVPTEELPFPQSFEKPCVDMVAKADKAPEGRGNVRQALLYCDAVELLRKAFDGWKGPVNADAFANRAQALGKDFVSASTYASGFNKGDYAGGQGYRRMFYDEKCACMKLDGDTVRFDS